MASQQPDIKIVDANRRGDRSLTLAHSRRSRRRLDDTADEVLKHVAHLWGFDVRLDEVEEDGKVDTTRETKLSTA